MPLKDPVLRREYQRKYINDRYNNDPSYRANQLVYSKANKKKYKIRNIAVVAEFRRSGCLLCDEGDHSCLQAHHKDPNEKETSIASMMDGTSVERLEGELAKCVCLCANCHFKLHAGNIKLEGEKNEKFINRLRSIFDLV
jgi:hypothetical protein